MESVDALISIIVPVYNTKDFLIECLESLIQQSYKNIEVILIDDGSNDGSEVLCDEYAEKDPRFQTVHIKNQGQGAARNLAVKIAKGTILAFLDSDDWYEPAYLELMLRKMLQEKLDCVICSFHYINEKGNVMNYYSYKLPKENMTGRQSSKLFLLENGIEGFSWNKLWRKDVFIKNDISFPRTMKYEDIVTVFDALSFCNKVGYLNQKLYNYRQRESSTVHDISIQNLFDYLSAIDHVASKAKKLQLKEEGNYYRSLRLINSTYEYKKNIRYYNDIEKKTVTKQLQEAIDEIDMMQLLYYLFRSNFTLKNKIRYVIRIVFVRMEHWKEV